MRKLLAKSQGGIGIDQHTQSVVKGCELLWKMSGDNLIKFYRISHPNPHLLLILAAYLHDIGKAGSHFQRFIYNRNSPPQAIRHEALSYLILQRPAIRSWFLQYLSEDDFNIICWAVAGHHRKFLRKDPYVKDSQSDFVSVDLENSQIEWIFKQVADLLGADHLPNLVNFSLRTQPSFDFDTDDDLIEPLLLQSIVKEAPSKELIACMKAALIVGDVYGSILDRSDVDLEHVVVDLTNRVMTEEYLTQIIDGKKINRLTNEKVWDELTDLQKLVSSIENRVTLIETGCGGGKTIAGYCWSTKHAIGHKLYFNFPTMTTTTASFEDYLLYTDVDAEPVHSTADHELERLGILIDEDRYSDDNEYNLARSLRAMRSAEVVCTADTPLGLLQNYHLSILGVAGFANGAFIFDEIHAYDEKMWAAFLCFIQFDVPCLLMTATLSDKRRRQVEEALAQVGDVLARPICKNPAEDLPRYQIKKAVAGGWDVLEEYYHSDRKILWVSNTVDRCIANYLKALELGLTDSICLHSRFKNGDRSKNQSELVGAFKRGRGPGGARLAFVTQIAELSLDLSGTDVLLSDVATVSALVQRLGRLNRDGLSPLGHFYPLPLASHLPYKKDDITQALEWLDLLPQSDISQSHLIECLRQVEANKDDSGVCDYQTLNHLDGVSETMPGSLRDSSGYSVDVVTEFDQYQLMNGLIKDVHDCKIRLNLFDGSARDWHVLSPTHPFIKVVPDSLYRYSEQCGLIKADTPGISTIPLTNTSISLALVI